MIMWIKTIAWLTSIALLFASVLEFSREETLSAIYFLLLSILLRIPFK